MGKLKSRTGRKLAAVGGAFACLGIVTGSALASHLDTDTLGHTTVEQRVVPTGEGTFKTLQLGPGEGYTLREELADAQPGRDTRRDSLAYFGQLSDFQLADEESPARVEFLDPPNGTQLPFEAAWRPWEALEPQIDDAAIRQLNQYAGASPIPSGDGSRAQMNFTLDTGDSADSQQLNETEWVRTLLEGGPLNPNSGSLEGMDPVCSVLNAALPFDNPANYTGVQDVNDFFEGPFPPYYDPNLPSGEFSDWPAYPNLMNRAQQTFNAAGVAVPSYVAFGNHDGLVQGNQAANALFEQVATGCIKPMLPLPSVGGLPGLLNATLNPTNLLNALATDPTKVALVPPDPKRQFVSKAQFKQVFQNGTQADGHGFDFVDPAQQSASNGAAGYYAWNPVPGFRFIALDSVCEAGVAGPAANGNIDDPQFQWLRGQLEDATAGDELVVLFSHHAPSSLSCPLPDEVAPPCLVGDAHGHDLNPGCDLDPRSSYPVRQGQDLVDLLHQFPNAIAWVAGHSHVNDVEANPGPNGTGFWTIKTAAEADWPQQNRLLQVMDNKDDTLSIFGTILDQAGQATAPPAGTDANTLDETDLASIGRTLSYNDPQKGAEECDPACGEGTADDRNVELLIGDPRSGGTVDTDPDDDGIQDPGDNCPQTPNLEQGDLDNDGLGDACDSDDDGDNVADASDNCPSAANGDQTDTDGDGLGDACDDTPGDGGGGGDGGGQNQGTDNSTQNPPPGGGQQTAGSCGNTVFGTPGADILSGTGVGDTLRGLAGRDRLLGLEGDDCLFGGGGSDRLVGGAGMDLLKGGAGGDRISASDGEPDRVKCGGGKDRVNTDPSDTLSRCEVVRPKA